MRALESDPINTFSSSRLRTSGALRAGGTGVKTDGVGEAIVVVSGTSHNQSTTEDALLIGIIYV